MRIRFSARSLSIAIAVLTLSIASFAQLEISVNIAPPELPVYEQPVIPGDGYIWTPGYWAWDGYEYFWVPGTWVLAPEPGYFWTPGYWAWGGDGYIFHQGYWGPQVGFYGGINYGFGYFGHGYDGGRWEDGHFFYNRAVNNVNVTEIRNVYNSPIPNRGGPRVSYNGGNGGIEARPTPQEERVVQEKRLPPVATQVQHVDEARANPALRVSENHGKPPIAATPRPTAFNKPGVVPASQAGRYTPTPRPVHPNELPPLAHAASPNTGNPNLDRQYQQQRQELYSKQQQERQALQQQQNQEHQQMQQRQANSAQMQQLEQRHQQQTQQMAQQHFQQQQQMQRQQPRPQQGRPQGRP
jgi:WXXGXW repeat (2 copies)